MPWPVPIPPNTRQNSTPELDNHPSDHNLISDALTAISTRVVLDSGAVIGAQLALSGTTDLVTVSIPPVAVVSRLIVNAVVYFQATASVNCTGSLTDLANTAFLTAGPINAGANVYGPIPLMNKRDLAANADPSYKVRCVVNAGGGSSVALAYTTYLLVAR